MALILGADIAEQHVAKVNERGRIIAIYRAMTDSGELVGALVAGFMFQITGSLQASVVAAVILSAFAAIWAQIVIRT